MTEPKNILVIRTDRIGDLVLTLPMAAAIKKQYPEARVTFLVRAYTRQLLDGQPFIDEVIVLKEQNGKPEIASNVAVLKRMKFDTAIAVSPDFSIALIVFLSSIAIRVGTGYRWYSIFFNRRVFEHRKTAERHEAEYNFNLLKPLGINDLLSEANADYSLKVSDDALELVKTKLKAMGMIDGEKFIIIHPGSGGSAVDLPMNKFKELALLFTERTQYKIILTGSEKEVNLCAELEIHGRTVNFAGKLTLPELVAICSMSSLFIANSTGPLHIAAALGKPVAGFYPKIRVCSPERWKPYNDNNLVFTPPLNCAECTREQCEKLDCMNTIDMKYVFDEIFTKFIEMRS